MSSIDPLTAILSIFREARIDGIDSSMAGFSIRPDFFFLPDTPIRADPISILRGVASSSTREQIGTGRDNNAVLGGLDGRIV